MTSQWTTYRTLTEDEDAPPPYDPIAPSTTPQRIQNTETLQSYPALDTSQNRHLAEATSDPPPPSIDYYPAMVASAPRPSPIAAAGSPYPQYPVYSPTLTMTVQPTSPVFQPHSYPLFNPHVPGSVQGVAYPVMSNPGSTRAYPTMELGPQKLPQQAFHPTPISTSPWDSQPLQPATLSLCTRANDAGNSFSDGPHILERDLINLEDSPVLKPPFISDDLSLPPALASPALATPSVPPVPPAPSEPETTGPSLVTTFRCKKCGAVLASGTANCKKLHTPTVLLGERQIRNVTRSDYGVGGSRVSSDDAKSTSTNRGASNGVVSPGPQNNRLLVQPDPGRQSHDYQRGAYEQHPQYQSKHEERVVSNSENNHGTDDIYLRRSFTAGAIKSLKGMWKRQSQTEHQIVAPPPLPEATVPPPHSDAPVNSYRPSLARSNTFSDPTPPFNPAYNPQPHPPHHYQQQQHHPTYPLYDAPQGHSGHSAPQPQQPYAPSPW